MHHFWDRAVRPLLDLVRPATILEVGAADGQHTWLLAGWARRHGATLHVVEPLPQFDVEAMTHDGCVVVHTDLSLNVLPHLGAVDVALIDGDHNWFTVLNELRLLQQTAREQGGPSPVVLAHDTGWPCARRDHYYDPESIPDAFRHPWLHVGLEDGQRPPCPKDVNNTTLCTATVEGGPRNGVLTAIEDFVEASDEPIALSLVRRQAGLGVLVPASRSELHPGLDAAVARITARVPKPPSGEQLIPRVIHRIWLGPDPVPDVFERYAESWREHHPEWELRLWRDDTLPKLSCQSAYEEAANWSLGRGEDLSPELRALETWRVRYDIVRLELLRQLGGVVIDMDMEAIRPLDPLLGDVTAFAGFATPRRRVGNQVLGAVPGHPFFKFAVRRLAESVRSTYTSGQRAGNGFLTRLLNARPEGVTIFPRETFHSPLTIEPPRRPGDFPEIYAVHHHLESYRKGTEERMGRDARRLHEAQIEIARLEREQRRAAEQMAREEEKRVRAEERLAATVAKLERLSESKQALRERLARR